MGLGGARTDGVGEGEADLEVLVLGSGGDCGREDGRLWMAASTFLACVRAFNEKCNVAEDGSLPFKLLLRNI